jgi:hypothetical protein
MTEKSQMAYDKAFTSIKGFCIPENVTLRQANDVVCKFLADTPARRHEGGSLLVSESLSAAWL